MSVFEHIPNEALVNELVKRMVDDHESLQQELSSVKNELASVTTELADTKKELEERTTQLNHAIKYWKESSSDWAKKALDSSNELLDFKKDALVYLGATVGAFELYANGVTEIINDLTQKGNVSPDKVIEQLRPVKAFLHKHTTKQPEHSEEGR